MIWSRQQMLQALFDQGVPNAGQVVDWAYPVTNGDEDWRGIEISTTLGPPVGVYGIYENLRLPDWPFGHDPMVADAMVLWRHRILRDGTWTILNRTVIGIRPPIVLPDRPEGVRDRWGPEPRGSVDDLLRVASGWRVAQNRAPQIYREQAWNNMAQYLADTNPFGA